MMPPRGSIYVEKSIGPRTDPWGKPNFYLINKSETMKAPLDANVLLQVAKKYAVVNGVKSYTQVGSNSNDVKSELTLISKFCQKDHCGIGRQSVQLQTVLCQTPYSRLHKNVFIYSLFNDVLHLLKYNDAV